jgi:putative peptidoglycan lipid II flippase
MGAKKRAALPKRLWAGLVFVLLILSAVCMIGMPWLMHLLAPGFSDDQVKFELAVRLTQITFPYLLCMSLVAFLSGVLNTFHRFVESSSILIILNTVLALGLLLGVVLGYRNDATGGFIQAVAVTVAGVLQLTYLAWGVHRIGFPMRMRRPRMSKGVRRLIAQGIPGAVAGGVTQINIVLGTMIASLEPGAVSQLYYADRLYELPLAMVGIALGVVLLPEVSRHVAAGNAQAAMESQNRSAELAMLLTVPAAVALMVIPGPIVSVFFERGAFTKADTTATSLVLAIFAAGLPSFVLIKVFSPAYFARNDTKTLDHVGASDLVVISRRCAIPPFPPRPSTIPMARIEELAKAQNASQGPQYFKARDVDDRLGAVLTDQPGVVFTW